MSWKPGDHVSPNVRLVRPLSSGSMGEVWVAFDRDANGGQGGDVAVKFIAETSSAGVTPEERDFEMRFAREARAGMRVQSPHVVRIFDHGLGWDGMPFIVMELCEGETLRAKMDRLGLLDMQDVVEITHHVAEGLAAAHDVDVIHRDVKPDNIMLDRGSGRVIAKVFDFGIAKQVSSDIYQSITRANTVVGSLAYMSPEQLLDPRKAQASFDAWGLAVTAYEALMASVPFGGKTISTLLMAHVKRSFPLPSEAGMSRAFDALFQRAFARDLDTRPDVRTFAAELRRAAFRA